MKTLTLIIPTLNEEEGISKVLEEIPERELSDKGYEVEVIVVDGGSSDGTRKMARENGAEVVMSNGRKAAAVEKGFEISSSEFVFLIDGDSSYPLAAIPEMMEELEVCDMVLGSRFLGEILEGSMSRLNQVGNKMLTWFANVMFGTDVTDLCTGLRGMRRKQLNVWADGFEIEAFLHAHYSDGKIREVPITYREREGDSKLRVWDGLNIAKRLLVERVRRAFKTRSSK